MPTSVNFRRLATAGAATIAVIALAPALPASAASPSIPVICEVPTVSVPKNTTLDGQRVTGYELVDFPTKAQSFTFKQAIGHGIYTPYSHSSGTDSFTFKPVVGDQYGELITVNFNLQNIRPVCAPPTAVSVVHDRVATIDPQCSDADGDTLTVVPGTTGAAHGRITIVDGKVRYAPAAGFTGTDVFTLAAQDGTLRSEEHTVNVTVTNQRPTCAPLKVTVSHDKASEIALNCTDADGDELTTQLVTPAQRGTATVAGTAATYKPAKGYLGKDAFQVTATDGIATTAPAKVSVEVTNTAPKCDREAEVVTRGKAVIDLDCTDRDGDTVTLKVTDRPNHGKLRLTGDRVIYTPAVGFAGKDSFKVTATDGLVTTRPSTVSLAVRSSRPQVVKGLLSGRAASLDIAVPAGADGLRGRVRLVIPTGRDKVNADGRFAVDAGQTDTVTLQLTQKQARRISGLGKRVKAVVVFRHDDFAGRADRHQQAIKLSVRR
jgi:hypothetical protein